MSGGRSCRCRYGKGRQRLRHWRVIDRRCNYSAFNGGHRTPSAYSSVRCAQCGSIWRTKASYVDNLYEMSKAEREGWLCGSA